MTIGETLKATRVKKKLTVETVRQATKIQIGYINALEEDNPSAFSAQIYYKAFLKNYATFLGLDAAELLKIYENARKAEKENKELTSRPMPFKYSNFKFSAIIVLFSLMLTGFIYLSAGLGNRNSLRYPYPLSTTNYCVKSVEYALPERQETTEYTHIQRTPTATAPQTILITTAARTWVKISDMAGNTLTERIMNAGEHREWSAQGGFDIILGHTAGVNVLFNGQRVDLGQRAPGQRAVITLRNDAP
ncbi:MAG: DUF4115 domain-containing protein [Elusimicrobia bacterium]|nr:DUF4115 domain-containing protein [Elusimicrobiota bacterium]